MKAQRRATILLPGVIALALGFASAGVAEADLIVFTFSSPGARSLTALSPSASDHPLVAHWDFTGEGGGMGATEETAAEKVDPPALPAREVPIPLPPGHVAQGGGMGSVPTSAGPDGGGSPALGMLHPAAPNPAHSNWLKSEQPADECPVLRFKLFRPPRP
jgi:hypothetical protein